MSTEKKPKNIDETVDCLLRAKNRSNPTIVTNGSGVGLDLGSDSVKRAILNTIKNSEENFEIFGETASVDEKTTQENNSKIHPGPNEIKFSLPEVKNRKGLSVFFAIDPEYCGFSVKIEKRMFVIKLGFAIFRVMDVSEAQYNRIITTATLQECKGVDVQVLKNVGSK